MKSLHERVDPELRGALDYVVGTLGHDFMANPDVAWRRRRFADFLAELAPPAPSHPEVGRTIVHAPGFNGAPDVRLLVYTPPAAGGPTPAIIYVHVGGFTLLSADMMDGHAAALAAELGCAVVSVDYRLAPEARHPAALHDCYAALSWTAGKSGTLGIDPARIALYGNTSGATLAAGTALMARDLGGPPLAFLMLSSAMLDDRMTAASVTRLDRLGVWDAGGTRMAWQSLLGEGMVEPDLLAYAAPARAGSLAGLPPTFIDVAELTILLDENIAFAQALLAADVETELHVYPGCYHSFDNFAPAAAISVRAVQTRHAAFRRALRI